MAEDRRSFEGSEGGGERRFFAKPKFCQFCADKTLVIDYKKTGALILTININRPPFRRAICSEYDQLIGEYWVVGLMWHPGKNHMNPEFLSALPHQ